MFEKIDTPKGKSMVEIKLFSVKLLPRKSKLKININQVITKTESSLLKLKVFDKIIEIPETPPITKLFGRMKIAVAKEINSVPETSIKIFLNFNQKFVIISPKNILNKML